MGISELMDLLTLDEKLLWSRERINGILRRYLVWVFRASWSPMDPMVCENRRQKGIISELARVFQPLVSLPLPPALTPGIQNCFSEWAEPLRRGPASRSFYRAGPRSEHQALSLVRPKF